MPSDREINSVLNRGGIVISFTPGEVVDEILEDLSTEFRKMVGSERFEELFPKGLVFESYKTRSILEAYCERVISEQPKNKGLKNVCRATVLESSTFITWKHQQLKVIEDGGKEFNRTRITRRFKGSGGSID